MSMGQYGAWLTMAMIARHTEMWMWEMPEEKIGPYNSDVLPKARAWWLEKADRAAAAAAVPPARVRTPATSR